MRQSYMHIRRRVIVAALAGALSAPALVAQPRVDVTTRLGGIKFDRAASLETSAFLGLDATYRPNPYFSLGTALNVTQANTTAEDFITSLSFGIPLAGDTTTFYGVGQAVNLIQASIIGVIRPMSGRGVMVQHARDSVNRSERPSPARRPSAALRSTPPSRPPSSGLHGMTPICSA